MMMQHYPKLPSIQCMLEGIKMNEVNKPGLVPLEPQIDATPKRNLHSRSLSDYTPILAPPPPIHHHRRAISMNSLDFLLSPSPEEKKTESKYMCPYCSKGFSRPSSLRIHTYSHTGERPFECPESGCARKFSVQSNMRRHLKVHRLGKPLKRKMNAQFIHKPLAAKPTTPTCFIPII